MAVIHPVPPAAGIGATGSIRIPEEVIQIATDSIGIYFERFNRMRPRDIAVDFMNPARCVKRMQELEQYAPLRGKKLLEIGSGYG